MLLTSSLTTIRDGGDLFGGLQVPSTVVLPPPDLPVVGVPFHKDELCNSTQFGQTVIEYLCHPQSCPFFSLERPLDVAQGAAVFIFTIVVDSLVRGAENPAPCARVVVPASILSLLLGTCCKDKRVRE